MRKTSPQKDVLIALMNSPADFKIAEEQHWYRIPVKSAPTMVKNKTIKFLAFYHTKAFLEEKYSIRYYAKVKEITTATRRQLFPNEPANNRKSHKIYYQLHLGPIQRLGKPIVSKRPRRLLFVPTTQLKLFGAQEFNDVFAGSMLEEKLWTRLQQEGIDSEREYKVIVDERGKKYFMLDFAIFCKKHNINLECDGFTYHSSKEAIARDKDRDKILIEKGWSPLRFTTEEINDDLDYSIRRIKNTIRKYGGIKGYKLKGYIRFDENENGQMTLFES